MDTEKTINSMSFEKAAEKKWYLSMTPASPKQTLEVTFNDGKAYKFLGTGKVNIGDPVIIDYGGASSYKMGNVTEAVNGITIKRTHALKPLFVFTTEPDKTDLKKNAKALKGLEDETDLKAAFSDIRDIDLAENGFHVTDYLIAGVLNAISVIAFPKLSGDKAVESAKAFLAEKKAVPGFVFGKEASSLFYEAISSAFPVYPEENKYSVSFTGFYPGWKEDLLSCSVWENKLGKVDKYWSEKENAYFLSMGHGTGALQSTFKKNQDFNKLTNELIFRSALSIIIRGGFVNLLDAALSAQMPIVDFYDDVVAFAKDIGSEACWELLKSVDYKNKKFEDPAKKTAKAGKKDAIKAPKEFKIKDGVLVKYSGDEETVVIPEGVKVIGAQSFDGLNIKKVVMPDTVTKIEGKPFYGGMRVEEIVFSKNLSSIASFAFAGCKSLKSVDLSETKLKTIRKKCFLDCYNLETVKLPKKLKSIEEFAFARIAAKEIVFPATVEKIATNAIFPGWSYQEMSITDLYFEGTDAIEFIVPGREFPLKIHCKKDSALWKMFEERNANNINRPALFGANKNVPLELIDYTK